jgi:2-oxoisovalerate dehydrogenase E1 component
MATFALHVEARRASALGEGFYTIGPCGEELLAAVGLVLNETDPVALHYRHLATQIARHARPLMMGANGLQEGGKDDGDGDAAARKLYPLYLDRARGYVVSSLDPVTGGAHCALGGGAHDHLVTSTLASQATPAVGRALAPGLMAGLNLSKKSGGGGGGGAPPAAAASAAAATKKVAANKKQVSYVSVGDGSVNNSHFLSAVNMAKYAAHKVRKASCRDITTGGMSSMLDDRLFQFSTLILFLFFFVLVLSQLSNFLKLFLLLLFVIQILRA